MKRSWIFCLLVLALTVYFWGPMLLMVLEVEPEPDPDPISVTKKVRMIRRPLEDHSKTAKRNLVGAPQGKGFAASEKMESIPPEGIRIADKDLGLSLVGTVLADDPKMNIAVIDNRITRQQERYHEGDRIGEVLVKRIFWDTVIIETKRGEELLVMSFEGTAGGSLHSSTDLEPTVSSGPLYGGSSSGMGAATRDGGNAAAGSGGSALGRGTAAAGSSGSALGRGTAATYSGGSFRSSRSSSEDSRSSSTQGEDGESSPPNDEPTVSSGPLW